MNLDEAQRTKVVEWIKQGLKLAEIQNRLISELKVTMTYMEVRMLVDDLKVMPKDPEPVKPIEVPASAVPPAASAPSPLAGPGPATSPGQPTGGPGHVSLTVDQLTRPGAVVSGKVAFTDGNTAAWQIDQSGRLGLIPSQPGYRPPASDVEPFQVALQAELAKLGF